MAKPYIKIVPVGPKVYLSVDEATRGIAQAVGDLLKDMKRDLEKVVETWDNKPRFDIDGPRLSGGKIEGSVGTDHRVFAIVNNGVRPHPIDASPGRTMRYRAHDYRAKTVPRQLRSRAGGSANVGAWRRRKTVNHPGVVAREFTTALADKYQPKFIRGHSAGTGYWGPMRAALSGRERRYFACPVIGRLRHIRIRRF